MAHKKNLLTKYLSGTESSDCRSPRHDGKNWFIPETSLSGPSEPGKQKYPECQPWNFKPARRRKINIWG